MSGDEGIDLQRRADWASPSSKRLKMLEDENARLKRSVAGLALDKQILQEVIPKKALKAVKRRELVAWTQERVKVNVRRWCRPALLRPSVWFQKSGAHDQSALRLRIREIAMVRCIWPVV